MLDAAAARRRPPTPREAFAPGPRTCSTRASTRKPAAAFEDFVARYPNNARAPEAYYWLGESYLRPPRLPDRDRGLRLRR